jgi:hypothetical protein
LFGFQRRKPIRNRDRLFRSLQPHSLGPSAFEVEKCREERAGEGRQEALFDFTAQPQRRLEAAVELLKQTRRQLADDFAETFIGEANFPNWARLALLAKVAKWQTGL